MSADPRGGSTLGLPRRPDIQGLRGLAVLLVVVFHAGLPVPGGFTGVDVFFAISGFVITAMLLKDLTSIGRINLRRFYARQVKRLGPALALMVATIAVLGTITGPVATQEVAAKTGLFASLFSANAYLYNIHTGYFDPAATLNPFLHTLRDALDSVVRQSFKDFDVVVVDDHSDDPEEARRVVDSIADPRFRSVYLDRRRGRGGARNQALRYCTGEHLSFLDDDDLLMPDKLKIHVSLLQAQSDVREPGRDDGSTV